MDRGGGICQGNMGRHKMAEKQTVGGKQRIKYKHHKINQTNNISCVHPETPYLVRTPTNLTAKQPLRNESETLTPINRLSLNEDKLANGERKIL